MILSLCLAAGWEASIQAMHVNFTRSTLREWSTLHYKGPVSPSMYVCIFRANITLKGHYINVVDTVIDIFPPGSAVI